MRAHPDMHPTTKLAWHALGLVCDVGIAIKYKDTLLGPHLARLQTQHPPAHLVGRPLRLLLAPESKPHDAGLAMPGKQGSGPAHDACIFSFGASDLHLVTNALGPGQTYQGRMRATYAQNTSRSPTRGVPKDCMHAATVMGTRCWAPCAG